MVPLVWSLWVGCEDPSTTIQSAGSETMVGMMTAFASTYHEAHPKVVVNVVGGGSGKGLQALFSGQVQIANSSRPITDEERAAAMGQKIAAVETIVAYDGIAVVVNSDNPIASVSLDALKCIFGAGGHCGKWSDAGVVGLDCGGSEDIVLHGRPPTSGTEEYFREVVLGFNGRFKEGVRAHERPEEILQAVAQDRCAIGYAGMGNHGAGTKVVCLADHNGRDCAEPSPETVRNGTYVLARPLYAYTRGAPSGAIKEYLDWVTSPAGQDIVEQAGFVPLQ